MRGLEQLGIALAGASLVIMPLVSWGKLRATDHIGSAALRAEAKETLACSYLSFTLLLGLVANATLGWWRADPIAALLMVPWLFKEEREGISAEQYGSDHGPLWVTSPNRTTAPPRLALGLWTTRQGCARALRLG